MWSPRESPTLSAKSLPGGGRQTPPAISPPFQKRQQLHQLGPARSWFIPARTTGKESSQAKAQNPPEPQAPGAARLPPGPTPQLAHSGPARPGPICPSGPSVCTRRTWAGSREPPPSRPRGLASDPAPGRDTVPAGWRGGRGPRGKRRGREPGSRERGGTSEHERELARRERSRGTSRKGAACVWRGEDPGGPGGRPGDAGKPRRKLRVCGAQGGAGCPGGGLARRGAGERARPLSPNDGGAGRGRS